VRAYNNAGFEATDNSVFSSLKVADVTPPSFSSALNISNTFELSWAAASDNQYAEAGNNLYYEIYRRDTPFAVPFNHTQAGNVLVATVVNSTSYQDIGLAAGVTYYYSLCAKDQAGNRTCDGVVQSRTAADTTPPNVLSFSTNKTPSLKRWTLSWSMSDTGTAQSALLVEIRRKITTTSTQPTDWVGESPISAGTGADYCNPGPGCSLPLQTGPTNINRYIHYQLKVTDGANNTTTVYTSVHSTNAMTITSVSKAYGTTAGGNTVIISGTGFSKDTVSNPNGFGADAIVRMSGLTTKACTSTTVVNDTTIICNTTCAATSDNGTCVHVSAIPSYVNVEVVNPDGSSTVSNSGYLYTNSSPDACDNPANLSGEMAGGDGSEGNPFLICTKNQFLNINRVISDGMAYNYRHGGFYFKLGSHIDLTGVPAFTHHMGSFHLDGRIGSGNAPTTTAERYSLVNFSHAQSGGPGTFVGLFRRMDGVSSIKNINLLNFAIDFNLTGNTSGVAIGGLFGYRGSGILNLENIFMTCRITMTGVVPHQDTTAACLIGNTGNSTFTNISVEAVISAPGGGKIAAVNGWAWTSTFNQIYILPGTQLSGGGTVGGVLGDGRDVAITRARIQGRIGSNTSSAVGGALGGSSYSAAPAILREVQMEATIMGYGVSSGLVGYIYGNTPIIAEDNIVLGNIASDVGQPKYAFTLFDYGGANLLDNQFRRNISTMRILQTQGSDYKSCGFRRSFPSSVATTLDNYYDSTQCNVSFSSSWLTAAQTTAQLQDQSNAIWSGFDFTPGTGKWKWCAASGVYPQLAWLPCP
jgi:hypothetical protein